MRWLALGAKLCLGAGLALSATCPSGAPLLHFHLIVEPGDDAPGHSVRSVNRIVPGQKLVYNPIKPLPEHLKKAQVALVLASSRPSEGLVVLEPKSARALAAWKVPFRASVVALVYGPQGLDTKKVSSLLKKDRELVDQLADYAQQTASTETLLNALAAWDRSPTATENLNAALLGFSAAFGRPLPTLNRNAPLDEQMATLMRALNPALATYDPLAPEPQQRMQQSALLAATVGGLFFGGPVGLAAGGASMFVNLSSMMFPDTDFRSAFAQAGPGESYLMCARRDRPRSRTRLAYLWAVRVPDADPPSLEVAAPARLLAGARTALGVRVGDNTAWRNLPRVRDWYLVSSSDSGGRIPVKVRPVPEREALEIDLTGAASASGTYRLAGAWDWETFEVSGELEVHGLSGEAPRLAAGVADRLVKGSGRVSVEIEGKDLEFVEKAELLAANVDSGAAQPLEFTRRNESAPGAVSLAVSLDTNALEPGPYRLRLSFPEGTVREVSVRLLPPHPKLEGLPIRVNLGEPAQRVLLRGSGLERIERIDPPLAEIELRDGVAAGSREALVRLGRKAARGDRIPFELRVEGLEQPLAVPGALEVIGPRPRIAAAQASLPQALGVELAEGELASGVFAGFSLRVEPLEGAPLARVECLEKELTLRAETARVDETRSSLRLRQAGAALFLSLDPGAFGRPGCTLAVVVSTDAQGPSEPFELGRVVRLPRIEKFEVTDQKVGELGYAATLEGEELELIERVGWDAEAGLPVTELPVPVAGGNKQSLRVTVPWPAPKPRAPLYVWLRGESEGRATSARY
jgi:hypothetical protein